MTTISTRWKFRQMDMPIFTIKSRVATIEVPQNRVETGNSNGLVHTLFNKIGTENDRSTQRITPYFQTAFDLHWLYSYCHGHSQNFIHCLRKLVSIPGVYSYGLL